MDSTAYDRIYRESLNNPTAFWGRAAEEIHWFKAPQCVLDDRRPPFYRWFVGGELNTCYNAIDRHIEAGRGAQPAVIYDSPVTGTVQVLTYCELRDRVARFAGVLRRHGVSAGDRVIVYMPMIPETLCAMLACARLGAIHSVVFGGFAPQELAKRIEDARPKLILSASCGIEGKKVVAYKPLLDEALRFSAHQPHKCIVYQRPQMHAELVPGRDLDWSEEVATAEPAACVPVAATDPLYILYTSGTTGIPKGVVATTAGMPWRCNGRCMPSTTCGRAKSTGPLPTSDGSWDIPTSSTVRCCMVARLCCTKASRWVPPTPVRSGV